MSVKVNQIFEISNLVKWLGQPPRNPKQTHGLNESDSEVVQIHENCFLAATTDSISEEISQGLYQDPYTMGWVTAQASLSDLAAVGTKPVGLLFSTQWGPKANESFKATVAQGFHDALQSSGTFLLGGDHGSADSTVLTGVGLGISEKKPVGRTGIRPGDLICLTGKTGRGPALSFSLLRGESREEFPESHYRPQARLQMGQALSEFASAMMDTSDGVLSTLNTLRWMNGVGFALEWNAQTLDPIAVEYCERKKIPLWLLWVGEHGDFELIVSVPPESLERARSVCPELHVIGKAIEDVDGSVVQFPLQPGRVEKVRFDIAQRISSGDSVDLRGLSKFLSEMIGMLKENHFP